MDADAIRRALRRIAHEIIERNPDLARSFSRAFRHAASRSRGAWRSLIEELQGVRVETGVIDVSMHRDDVGQRANLPIVQRSRLPLPLDGRTVIIVDDVFYTGRTMRAAMDAIGSFGRPARFNSRR